MGLLNLPTKIPLSCSLGIFAEWVNVTNQDNGKDEGDSIVLWSVNF